MVFLVVEDSRPARNLIKNYIGEIEIGSPYLILEAENGEAALNVMKVRSIDFVFLDWNLSDKMTGLDVLKEMRKMDQYKQVPVFMVSCESDKVHVIESMKFGANDFIVKPIDQKTFMEKVLKTIKERKK
jgi:two-component system chemotaxis response regulator CheY